jgi:periplasmic protein TonB
MLQQPEHLLAVNAQATPRRALSIVLVALFHVAVIAAFVTGLASRFVEKLPEDIIAKVEPPKLPDVKPPPPPPPDLAKPPPPFVPPPDIVIEQTTTNTNAITVQHQVAVIAPPKPSGITAPASIGRAHECNSNFYPPIAQRLNQEGVTVVSMSISPDGEVSEPKVTESSGHDSLDSAALRCVQSWHYKAAMQNGSPIATTWTAKVIWKLPQ